MPSRARYLYCQNKATGRNNFNRLFTLNRLLVLSPEATHTHLRSFDKIFNKYDSLHDGKKAIFSLSQSPDKRIDTRRTEGEMYRIKRKLHFIVIALSYIFLLCLLFVAEASECRADAEYKRREEVIIKLTEVLMERQWLWELNGSAKKKTRRLTTPANFQGSSTIEIFRELVANKKEVVTSCSVHSSKIKQKNIHQEIFSLSLRETFAGFFLLSTQSIVRELLNKRIRR